MKIRKNCSSFYYKWKHYYYDYYYYWDSWTKQLLLYYFTIILITKLSNYLFYCTITEFEQYFTPESTKLIKLYLITWSDHYNILLLLYVLLIVQQLMKIMVTSKRTAIAT